MKLKDVPWIPFVILAIAIGLYPFTYYLIDMHSQGLLQTKPKELVNDTVWHTAFYIHITFGGVALLTGWSQLNQKLRNKYLTTHRMVGKIYVIAVFLSSCAGLFIAFFSTGGIICVLGFGLLALSWLFTIIKAYTSIRRLDITEHRKWMIRNYALTFAAVTLRIWLPMGQHLMHIDFFLVYRIVSWLSWVPNLIIAELFFIRKRKIVVRNAEGAIA